MKENKYNNSDFFDKYSKMNRSMKGLSGAGEWNSLKRLLPNFKHKKVLDLGCGYGWHCFYASEKGADAVIGVDISSKMLAVAKEKNNYNNISFLNIPIEDISFAENTFDVVLSSLAFHYIESFEDVVKKIHSCLKKNGKFIFSVEHPVFTAEGSQKWYKNDSGEILHFPVDNYFYEGKRNAVFFRRMCH